MSVNKNIVLAMMIAGALSGLAGVAQYVGNSSNMQIGVMPSQGFDGIAVSLLGANSPLGILVSAIFFGLLYSGKGFMNAAVPMVVKKFKKMKANKAGDTGVGILPNESEMQDDADTDKEEK